MDIQNTLFLEKFFPKESLKIIEVINDGGITIHLKSITKSCICPACHKQTEHYHGTYVREVQDLPILGTNVRLQITAHEYWCDNDQCEVTAIAESYDGFVSSYSRMTERCADFICTLALETSCEGCSRICNAMNLKVSGDTVIRLLTRRFTIQEQPICSEVIGVDDFAFKTRHKYGTIIVDGVTHQPVAILAGRDGKTLREWLQNNKHVKVVTRDRASAYAAAIQEILPDAMQIADRFHLHQNLLDVVRNTVNTVLPVDIRIPSESEQPGEDAGDNGQCKKNP
jgi:transposase